MQTERKARIETELSKARHDDLDRPMYELGDGSIYDLAAEAGYSSARGYLNEGNLWGRTLRETIIRLVDSIFTADGFTHETTAMKTHDRAKTTADRAAITNDQIEAAAKKYPRAVTGTMAGCKHPAALLRWVLESTDAGCRRLAENYIRTGHGACWTAMCNTLPADGWIVFYAGGPDR